jgi:hypothetical protein
MHCSGSNLGVILTRTAACDKDIAEIYTRSRDRPTGEDRILQTNIVPDFDPFLQDGSPSNLGVSSDFNPVQQRTIGVCSCPGLNPICEAGIVKERGPAHANAAIRTNVRLTPGNNCIHQDSARTYRIQIYIAIDEDTIGAPDLNAASPQFRHASTATVFVVLNVRYQRWVADSEGVI